MSTPHSDERHNLRHQTGIVLIVLVVPPTDKVPLPEEQLDNPNKDERHSFRRQVFIMLLLVITVFSAVAWILSITNVIGNSPWSSIFSALLTIISVVAAVLQFFKLK